MATKTRLIILTGRLLNDYHEPNSYRLSRYSYVMKSERTVHQAAVEVDETIGPPSAIPLSHWDAGRPTSYWRDQTRCVDRPTISVIPLSIWRQPEQAVCKKNLDRLRHRRRRGLPIWHYGEESGGTSGSRVFISTGISRLAIIHARWKSTWK
jgi:hypothetical protein